MKTKSINQMFLQLSKFRNTKYFMKAYFAYLRAFENRFGFAPHTKKCAEFVSEYGKDFAV